MKVKVLRSFLLSVAVTLAMAVSPILVEAEGVDTDVYMIFAEEEEDPDVDSDVDPDADPDLDVDPDVHPEVDPNKPGVSDKDDTIGGVSTGDETNIMLYIGFGIVGAIGGIGVLMAKKRRRDEE